MAVQLVSDEVHVTTGEPWRRWLDDGTRKRIREVDHACGWEAAAMEPGDLRKRGGVQPPRRRASRAVAVIVVAAGPSCAAGEDVAARRFSE
jgi:hypothetical protein